MFSHGPMRNIGFLGRWGTYACPQCLPSDIVPIRSWTRTLRPPGIRHRHLPYHTIPYYQTRPVITMTASLLTTHWGRVPSVHRIYYPVLAWPINLQAYAMPSVPVPPITSNIGFPGGGARMPARSVCLVTVPIRSWTRTLRRPGIRHRHLPYHTIPSLPLRSPRGSRGRRISAVQIFENPSRI